MLVNRLLSSLSRTLLWVVVACIFTTWSTNAAFAACAANQIDVNGDGSQCESAKFSVTTTATATELSWIMGAYGTFYVDCGDGGTLIQYATTPSDTTTSGSVVSGKSIVRAPTKDNENFGTIYRCSWSNAGSHTLRFSGVATGYSGYMAAIRFYSTQYCVAAIDGSLGAMLPVTDGVAPKFLDTFRGTKIRSIPENLFSGIDTSSATNTSYMFIRTFQDTEITSIPAGLFSGIDTSSATDTSYMFTSTFQSTPITSIPAGLFSGIDTSSATNPTFMFSYTFYNCRSLAGYIPPTAFSKNIPSNNSVWLSTFNYTNLATTCPAGTVQYITRYEDEWNGNVSCQTCAAAGLPQVANGCRTPCSFVSELHIGDNVYPLYSDKTHASSPVLHVGSGNDVCYAFMEPDTNGDKPGLHINYNGNPHVVIAPQP